jgi:hypothetical protein
MSLGIMVGNNPKQEAENPVGTHKTYIVELFATDYFRHRDMLGSFEITASSMMSAIEGTLERMPKDWQLFAKAREKDSSFFELFGIAHGIHKTVVTGLRDEDHADNLPTVGSIVRANETGRFIGSGGRDVA